MSPVAFSAPAFICVARPRGADTTLSARSRARWTVASRLPPSTTTTSTPSARIGASASKAAAMRSPSLSTGTMIDKDGMTAWRLRAGAVYQRNLPAPQAFGLPLQLCGSGRPRLRQPIIGARHDPPEIRDMSCAVRRASAREIAAETDRDRTPAEWRRCARRRVRSRTACRGVRASRPMRVTRPMRVPAKFGMPAAPLLITVVRPAASRKSRSAARQVCVEANTSICDARRIASSLPGISGRSSASCANDQPASAVASPCTIPTRRPPTSATRCMGSAASRVGRAR